MNRLRDYLLVLLTILAVSAAIVTVYRPAAPSGSPIPLERAREIFPSAERVLPPPNEEPDFMRVVGPGGENLGGILASVPQANRIFGYAGPTPLLVAVDPSGEILRVDLLPNYETPSYLRLLFASDFLQRWRGMHWREAARETGTVDAVSGVTCTAVAIAETLRLSLSSIDPEAKTAHSSRFTLAFGGLDVALISLALFGLLLALFPARFPKWASILQQGVTILVLGGLAASMLSLALLGGWLRSGRVSGSAGILFLVISALIVPIVFRQNFYCRFVCPFGAMQELLFKLTPFRLKLRPRTHARLRWIRYGLLTLAGISLLYGAGLDLNDIEPFSAFRPSAAGLAALVIAVGALLLSILLFRPWCTYGCGTGALLDVLKRPRIARDVGDGERSSP